MAASFLSEGHVTSEFYPYPAPLSNLLTRLMALRESGRTTGGKFFHFLCASHGKRNEPSGSRQAANFGDRPAACSGGM
jgi:hypothetical protein